MAEKIGVEPRRIWKLRSGHSLMCTDAELQETIIAMASELQRLESELRAIRASDGVGA